MSQVEVYNLPCVDGKTFFASTNEAGAYIGKGDVHDSQAKDFTKYGAYFNTTGEFAAGSLTSVYMYGRKILW